MALRVNRATSARGGLGPFSGAGAPSAGTNEVQTITTGGTGGTSKFRLQFKNQETADISWSATNNTLRDNIDAALEALSGIGTGGVTTAVGTATAGIGTFTVTFTGPNAGQNVPLMTRRIISGALTVSIAETTPGVPAAGQGAGKGALYIDTTNATLYINTGTANSPVWTQITIP